MNKMYHVFCEGDNVLFRDDADYISFNNRLAISAYGSRLTFLAETIMSTHFHCLVEASNEDAVGDFTSDIKRNYAVHYSRKYGFPISAAIRPSTIAVDGVEMAKSELVYILKNPVHHYVTEFPLEYEYTSAQYMFMHNFISGNVLKSFYDNCCEISALGGRRKREILGTAQVPDNWLVSNTGMILPSSYVNIPRAKAFWDSNVKAFLYDMNKNATDARKEIISRDILDLRTSGENDIRICEIIDSFCKELGKRSHHHLNKSELKRISDLLRLKHIPEMQIRRCLWL